MKVCDRCRGEENIAQVIVVGGEKAQDLDLCSPCRVLFTGVTSAFVGMKGDVELATKKVVKAKVVE